MIDPSYPVFLWQFTCLGDLAPCSYVFSKSLFPYFLHTICDLETATWCHIHLIFCEAKRVGVLLQRKQEYTGLWISHFHSLCSWGLSMGWQKGETGGTLLLHLHFYSISPSTPSALLLLAEVQQTSMSWGARWDFHASKISIFMPGGSSRASPRVIPCCWKVFLHKNLKQCT